MKKLRLILTVLGMLYLSPGFSMHSGLNSIRTDALDVAGNLGLETDLKAVNDKLSESNVVHVINIEKGPISEKEWSLNVYKYSGIYIERATGIYLKFSRFIFPGLEHTSIIFPFHDFI